MTTRELFEKVRSDRKNPFSLRTRLTVLVTSEMLACVAVAYGLDWLLNQVIPMDWEVPLILEQVCICLLVGILVTSLLSQSFFAPIKRLRRAMDRVAQGDYETRLEGKSSSKEIMELYTGFNLMVHQLHATEILQTDFVSNVSHEFKTPISAIEGYSTLLQDGDNLSEEQREYVEKILFNTRRLSSLHGSILLLSKLENQQISTNETRYRLDEQIRQSVVALEPEWEQKNIEFDVELDRVFYVGNESIVRHVWDNLISNAIKFSPADGLIRMRLTQEGQQLVFTIEDQGPGVTEKTKAHLFEKFFQGDSSHKETGNGLGLALVKRILILEDGQISVENRPEGGCCFTVTLPQ